MAAYLEKKKPEDTAEEELLPGLDTYWLAWHSLKDDRHFGSMGGMAGIYYSAMSQYAYDNKIIGSEFQTFLILVRALDAEYLLWQSEQKSTQEMKGDDQ